MPRACGAGCVVALGVGRLRLAFEVLEECVVVWRHVFDCLVPLRLARVESVIARAEETESSERIRVVAVDDIQVHIEGGSHEIVVSVSVCVQIPTFANEVEAVAGAAVLVDAGGCCWQRKVGHGTTAQGAGV